MNININEIINSINNNTYFYGMLMILLNMGSKYIEMDLVNNHKEFLSSTLLRRLLIFTMAFIATKDLVASLIITAAFIIIVLNLFNTESDYCIINKPKTTTIQKEITQEQVEYALDILKKAGKIPNQ